MPSTRSVIDLFSGCGGISRGFSSAGFDTLLGLDTDADSLTTFAGNHPRAQVLGGDIRDIPPSEVRAWLGLQREELDCLVGGPPCQSFSKNTPAKERFFDDPRNHLYRWFMDFVEEFRPRTVLVENVAELANAHNGFVREEILERLDALGYETIWRRLLAADYGVPQMRRRVFFLASRVGGGALQFPSPTHRAPSKPPSLLNEDGYVTVKAAISDLPRLNHGEGQEPAAYRTPPTSAFQRTVRRDVKKVYDHVARKLAPAQLARLRAIQPGQRMKDLPDHLRPRSGYGGAYSRLSWEEPALTITTWVFHPGSGRFGHPEDDRTITMREAARIQGFDDAFRFHGSYNSKSRQIGNAVPPLLAKQLAQVLSRELDYATA
jgi:DNA (cytosine-5)-methyltransferase 1